MRETSRAGRAATARMKAVPNNVAFALTGAVIGALCGSAYGCYLVSANRYFQDGFLRLSLVTMEREATPSILHLGIGFFAISLVASWLSPPRARVLGPVLVISLLFDWILRRVVSLPLEDLLSKIMIRVRELSKGELTIEALADPIGHYRVQLMILVSGILFASLAAFIFARRARQQRVENALFRPPSLDIRASVVVLIPFLLAATWSRLEGYLIQPPSQNVIVIIIDTLGAKHLGLYGYSRDTTPVIDAFARGGVVFENCLSQSSWTKTSVPSMITGTYPVYHQVMGAHDSLHRSLHTWAEVMGERGYRTAAFQSNPWLMPRFGFAQGFDEYHYQSYEKTGADIETENVLEWLRKNSRRRFFLYVHYMDVHSPYDPPARFRKFGDEAVDLYDGEIRFVDSMIGFLLEELESLELRKETIIVIASDHGEEFAQHGGHGHGKTLYQEVIHVPLILVAPQLADLSGRRIVPFVGNIDVMPTVLDLVGIESARYSQIQGRSLLPLLQNGNVGNAPVFSEVEPLKSRTRILSLVTEHGIKLIVKGDEDATLREELYDLRADRSEQANLAERPSAPTDAEELQQLIEAYRALTTDLTREAEELALDDETRRRLQALGYL